MKLKWLAVLLVGMGTGLTSSAALQFTNLTVSLFPAYSNRLNTVAYGGTSNFVAVGDNAAYVAGNFVATQPFITLPNWTPSRIANGFAAFTNLTAVASSGNYFLASGDNNLLFGSTNGKAWSTNYAKIFATTARAAGLAYNNGNFVTVATAPTIGFTNAGAAFRTNWISASIDGNPSFESYRGVTAFGSNSFAVCGVFGLVRISTNSGASWHQVYGQIGQPDLYGIASDSVKTLVCVGATNATTTPNAMILVSTNAGANWQVAYFNSATNTLLKSVAYTGSGYLAVGKGGLMLSSSNGLSWSQITNFSTYIYNSTNSTSVPTAGLDLNGVTFATTNYMHDVGEIVGANGNVILAAEPPPTNNSLGNKWISIGVTEVVQVGTNVTLPANTLQVTNRWGTNIVIVDWFNADRTPVASGTVFITNGMFSYTPPFITDNADNVTNTYYAQARDLRTGFINTNWTKMVLTNFMRPTATMITTNTICNGDSTTVQVVLTGNGPWTNVWTDGFISYTNTVGAGGVFHTSDAYLTNLTLPNGVFNPTNVFLNQATNHYYWVSKLSDFYFPMDDPKNLNPSGANWAGDLSGTDLVTVNPRPTVAVVTTNTICNGDSQMLQANLTGIGPWTVYWTDGFANYTQTVPVNAAGPYTDYLTIPTEAFNPENLFLNAITNHFYWVVGVSDQNCSAVPSDISGLANITVNPRPTATLVTTNTICNGDVQVLQANLTGLGPWTVYWTDGFTNFTQNVTVYTAGPYLDNLTILNSAFNPTNEFLNQSTNHYYWVTSVTDSNCLSYPSDITGTNLVTVNPRPTATLVTTNTICNGDATVLQANLTGIGPWTVYWTDGFTNFTQSVSINAAGPYLDNLTILNSAFNPTNEFLNQSTNHYYWVTSVMDSNCLTVASDITGTNLVTVNPRPTATLVTTNTICNGDATVLQANLTGIGPWTVNWTDGFTNYTQTVSTNIVGPYTDYLTIINEAFNPTNVFLNQSTNHYYWVTSVTDSNCLTVASDITGTNLVTVNPRPTATLVTTNTICNGDATVLQASLTGLGPWTVHWTDGFTNFTQSVDVNAAGPYLDNLTILNNAFNPTNVFLNQSTNHYYWVTSVTDGNCLTVASDITGTNLVTVNPRPTAAVVTTNTICNGAAQVLQANLTGIGPWTVYWTDGFTNFTQVVAVNAAGPYADYLAIPNGVFNPTNEFPNQLTNHYYWVTSVVDGNCVANGTDISGRANITVNPRPTVTLVTTNTICNGAATVLQANLTGLGPWTVYWTDGFTNYTQVVNVNAGPYVDTLNLPNSAFNPTNVFPNQLTNHYYWVTSVSNADTCLGNQPGDITGTNLVTVNPRPTATLVTTNAICNGDTTVLQANLTGLGPWTVYWTDGFTNYTQVVAVAAAGPYADTLTIPNGAFNPTNEFANQFTNHSYWVTGVSNADTCIGNQPGDITGINLVKVNPRPTAALLPFTSTDCNIGTSYVLTNTLTGIGPWVVTWNDGYSQTTNVGQGSAQTLVRTVYPTNSFKANLANNNVYFVTSVSNADSCIGNLPGDITGVVTNIVNPRPTAVLTSFNTNNCNDGTSRVLTNTLTGIGPWVVTWNDGYTQTTNVSLGSTQTLVRTVYPTNSFGANTVSNNVYYVTTVSNADSCIGNLPGDIIGAVTNTVNPRPTATLVTTNTICVGDTALLPVTLTGIGPWFLNWSDGTNEIVNTNVSGPFVWTRQVSPTNVFPNQITNRYYWLTSISDSTSCGTNVTFDIKGTNKVIVNPRSTLTFLPIATNAVSTFAPSGAQTNRAKVISESGGIYLHTTFKSGTNYVTLYITNRIALTGLSSNVVWSEQCLNPAGTVVSTNVYAKSYPIGVTNIFVITNRVYYSTPGTNFIISAAYGTNAGLDCAIQVTNDVQLFVNATPSADVNIVVPPEVNTNQVSVCSGTPVLLQVDLGGFPPWTNLWSDGYPQISTNTPMFRLVTLTNTTLSAVTNNYWITNLSDKYTNTTHYGIDPTNDLTGPAVIVVYPIPTNAPISAVSQTSCVGLPAPELSVTVAAGDTADWYDATGTNLVFTGTNFSGTSYYTPTNRLPGVYLYYAQEVNAGDCGTNQIAVYLMLNAVPTNAPANPVSRTNCAGVLPNPALSVTVGGGNTANWYDYTRTNSLTNGTTIYVPTNNTAGVYPFFVTEVNASGCESTNQIEVDLVLLACTNPPAITLSGTNGTIQWFGNLTLQSTTNLAPPAWQSITNGSMGTNVWNWTNGVPPINFFRLSPTN